MALAKFAVINGKIKESHEAVIPVGCQGTQYGLGVFEGIRCYDTPKGPAIFRLEEHARRLMCSALKLGMEPEASHEKIKKGIVGAVAVNHAHDKELFSESKGCYIRPYIGFTGDRIGLVTDPRENTFFVLVYKWDKYFEKGVNLELSMFLRPHPASFAMSAKACGTYLNSYYASRQAKTWKYDDALMLDHEGFVAEATTSNIFLAMDSRNRKIITPNSRSILQGITRDTVIRIADDLKIEILETKTLLESVWFAQEAFLTGTAVEISHIASVDLRNLQVCSFMSLGGTAWNKGIAKLKQFDDGKPGPLTTEIKEYFGKIVRGEIPKYEKWLTYI